MKIYYAHCQSIYNTLQEKRDIELLENLGFDVVNPNDSVHVTAVKKMREEKPDVNVMPYFYNLVKSCSALAFRALPDGSIPAGVGGELNTLPIPVIELPSGISRRVLTVEQTKEYLKEVGQR